MLKVDLTKKEITEETLDENIAKLYLGGTGYACRYLYDRIDEDTDPLSADNILMFMNGPFCGSAIPNTGKFVICAKSPYTDIWGEANCGGFFGPELKKAGFDGIIITGASKEPVYLEITENNAELKDASELWGKGTLETDEILKEKSGDKFTRVACIGQAGENLVKYAIIASEEKAAGRTGMGAVMGSKKLKAITVRAQKRKFEAAEEEGLKELINETRESIMSSFASQMLNSLGTSGGVDMYNIQGELPIKYWTKGQWMESYNISGSTASEKIFTRNYPCFSCPIACAKKTNIQEGKYKTEGEIEAPEYETVVGFGSLILNDDLESIVRANYLCNDYGIDTISAGSTIAFVYYLYNNGKISSEDIEGLEPEWGKIEPALKLIEKIVFRDGIGDVLAEGSNATGKKFGIPKDEIATVYGMEVPYHDLRSNFGMAVAYALGTPRGPCHCSCDMFNILIGIPLEEFGIGMIDKYNDGEEMAIASARAQDLRSLFGSLIMCEFANPPPSIIAALVKKVTGFDCDLDKLRLMAERIYMIKRLFNLKMGLTADDDKLPKLLLEPLEESESAGKTPNFQKLKEAYYHYRTFDLKSGYPSQEKLQDLGLDNL
ncbi:MAG: aldehyde ferredoxin oxidoreductase [Candidatus Lokiarchaeota archaeon]|nr:aldehyde ferredoxin oxidoreductase [Candidatus Lokiarchaeota archaeon]